MIPDIKQILEDPTVDYESGNKLDLVKLSRKGLTFKNLQAILHYTALTMKDIAKIISLSERQLQRYRDEQLLRTDISVQLLQILELYSIGYEVLGSKEKFKSWMTQPNLALGSLRPIELLDTSFGIQMIQEELGRIEHGVVS